MGHQRPPVRITRPAPRETVYTTAWLLLDLPTAVLLAVFVGTGWLGYAQHFGSPDQPRPAVVVPADTAVKAH
ncbi:hypothetical protein [Nocardia inohanensis]|uniref:hypothetical protein n=1 Tax=Nocardia inohanensis TaxID=209246 RepID=UPI000AB80E4F|nr:hypothetical protein [Nocardia inohanensis]